jgi:hypothetical protein
MTARLQGHASSPRRQTVIRVANQWNIVCIVFLTCEQFAGVLGRKRIEHMETSAKMTRREHHSFYVFVGTDVNSLLEKLIKCEVNCCIIWDGR